MKRRSRAPLAALFVAFFALVVLPGCLPPAPGPAPGGSCAGTPAEAVIREAFAGTGQEERALQIAWRESGCEPCRFYPSSTDCNAQPRSARGLFQFVGHDDLLFGACPGAFVVPWADPWCNAWAARFLWNGSGWAPWGG